TSSQTDFICCKQFGSFNIQYGGTQSLGSRYFMAGRSSLCNICSRMGHVARSCYFHKVQLKSPQKSPTCVLCGVQGHVQRDCPSRPCSTCGLPSHGLNPCRVPPVWKQHCQRCGVTGHLFDVSLSRETKGRKRLVLVLRNMIDFC
uniref:Zinc finger CCHC domain-containing protein 7 n=1 Tax=Xiphophorus couchianus TaxID=32473 RepID=A0A3B5L482_9TELE